MNIEVTASLFSDFPVLQTKTRQTPQSKAFVSQSPVRAGRSGRERAAARLPLGAQGTRRLSGRALGAERGTPDSSQ